MKFDSKEQQKLVLDVVNNTQITTTVNNLSKVFAEFAALVKAITEAEAQTAEHNG